MSKNNQQFQELLRDEVNLNQSRLDRLNTSVQAVNGHLKDNLTGYQKMERQGSYALGTLIKPVDKNDEYDADIQIVMNPNPNWQAKDYVNAIYSALKQNHNYADKLRLKTRCVTIDYAGDYHLDVVPRVTSQGRHLRLQSGRQQVRADRRYGIPGLVQREEPDYWRQLEAGRETAQVPSGPQEQLHRQVHSADHPCWRHHQDVR